MSNKSQELGYQNPGFESDGNVASTSGGQSAPYTLSNPIKAEAKNISDIEKGQPANVINSTNDGQWGNISGLSEKVARIKFIRKVYLVLTAQLLFTFGIVLIFVLWEPVKKFAKTDTGLILYLVSYGVYVVLVIVSTFIVKTLRKVPYNYIFLGLITLSMTYMLSMISAYHDTEIVLIAIAITFFIVLGVTVASIQTKYDFTHNCWLLAICLAYALIGFAIAAIVTRSHIMTAVYGGLGALVMSIFLAIDTQLLLGNKRFAYNPEDYITAAMQIYLDICIIFLYILRILAAAKK